MKKLNKELQENNLFQDLEVFENNRINKDIDRVYELLEKNFGAIGSSLSVCGSVAKIMHGTFEENYKPKDVDFIVKDVFFYRFLKANIQKLNVDFRIDENRIILFFPNIIVELWQYNPGENKERINGKFKNKIHYSYL